MQVVMVAARCCCCFFRASHPSVVRFVRTVRVCLLQPIVAIVVIVSSFAWVDHSMNFIFYVVF